MNTLLQNALSALKPRPAHLAILFRCVTASGALPSRRFPVVAIATARNTEIKYFTAAPTPQLDAAAF